MKQSGWIGFAPRRDATRPQYGQNGKVSSRIAATASCVDTSTCSPVPRVRRAKSAPSEPMAAQSAAWKPDWSPKALSGGRPREAERRDRGHHEPGVQTREALPVEPVGRHVRRVHLVDEEVGALHEAGEDVSPPRPREVERDAALVRVEVEEEPALLGMRHAARKGPAPPRGVARLRP